MENIRKQISSKIGYSSYNETSKLSNDGINESFLVSDVLELMKSENINKKVINIDSWEGSDEDKLKNIKDIIKNNDDSVILISSYISKYEYSEDDYYMKDRYLVSKSDELIKIDVDDIIRKRSNFLIRMGFVNINSWIGYENKEAFIYPNEDGIKVLSSIYRLLIKD